MKFMKDNVATGFVLVGIWTLIGSIWSTMELACYGITKPSIEDSIIGFVLMVSLYLNFKHWHDS